MRKKLLALLAIPLAFASANAQTDVTSTYIKDADFSDLSTNWTSSKSEQYSDLVNGVIGTASVQDATSTTDDNHPSSMNCIGVSVRWQGNHAAYQQTTSTALPEGYYTLTYDVENPEGSIEYGFLNMFYVKVGEKTYYDPAMSSAILSQDAAKSWVSHSINFRVTSESNITISLGYGNHNNEEGNKEKSETPRMFVSNLKLKKVDITSYSESNTWDMTSFVAENDFERGTYAAWTTTTGAQNNGLTLNRTKDDYNNSGAFTFYAYENWNSTAFTGKMYQTVENLPSGLYKVEMAAFVNPLAEDNATAVSQYVYFGDTKVALTTSNNAKYEGNAVVTNAGTLEIGLAQDAATANWMGIDNVKLYYCGKVIASEAEEIPSSTLTAEGWYKYTVTVAGEYKLTASTQVSDIVYTTDGMQAVTTGATYSTEACEETMNLSAGTYYFKSSSAQMLSIEATTKSYILGDATITPADGSYMASVKTVTIAYDNAITNDASASLRILKTDGVTCGDKTASLSISDNTVTATFGEAIDITLNGTAAISIAAGTIGYNSDNANSATTVTYKNGCLNEGIYYLYDNEKGTFLSMGGSYQTEAVSSYYGMPLQFSIQSDGCYTIQFVNNGTYLYDAQDNKNHYNYTDNSTNNHWIVSAQGEGLYTVTNGNETDHKGWYLYNDGTNVCNNETTATSWKLLTATERKAVIEAALAEQEAAVAASAGVSSIEAYTSLCTASKTDYVTTIAEKYQGSQTWNATSVSAISASSLPEGIYKVHADVFYRCGFYNESDQATNRAYIKAVAGENTYVMAIASPFEQDVKSTEAWAGGNVTFNGYYYPNDRESANAAMKAGNYGHDLYVYVGSEGTLTVTFNYEGGLPAGSWICYNNVSLTYYVEPAKITEQGKMADNEYYATYVTTAPTDLSQCKFTAYSVTTSGTSLTYTEQEGIVPTGTPLVICGTAAGDYKVAVSTETTTAIASNDLKVATSETKGDGSSTYILENKDGQVGWYLCANDGKINEDKCYLVIENSNAVKFIGLDGIASGISSVSTEQSNTHARYNLSGQRVGNDYKGVVIENGKKYLQK